MFRSIHVLILCAATAPAMAEPLITSWFTDLSGRYARIYETIADEAAGPGNAVTTWNRGQGVQSQPTYAGVHEITSTATDVYIRTTGLGFHIMGPWYGNEAKTNLFPNYPANRAVIFRFPRTPSPQGTVSTGGGAIGYFVDGVAMFDSRDAFSYDTSAGQDEQPNSGGGINGDDIWLRDAFVNEGVTFDNANAHQAGSNHHYHANPPGLRHLLGDSVDYTEASNTYTENFNGKHSPILGWVRDGYPVYGPYAYSDPTDPASGVRRMITGFQKRDGSNGSTNLATTGRTTLPAWSALVQGIGPPLAASQFGPAVAANGEEYQLGHYLQDYAYKGDLNGYDRYEGVAIDGAYVPGTHFDLDKHNGRFCVTPEFPGGTFAYFVAIEADGTPTFPYNMGRQYYGNPNDGGAEGSIPTTSIDPTAVCHFEGGPERDLEVASLSVDDQTGNVTVQWDSAAGGIYQVQTSSDLSTWTDLGSPVTAADDAANQIDNARAQATSQLFYRVQFSSVAPFDDAGFDYDTSILTTPPAPTSITVTLTTGGSPPPSNLGNIPQTVTFNGAPVTVLSRPSQYELELDVDPSSLADGNYNVVATWGGAAGTWSGTHTVSTPPPAGNNILLLIVDDWGVDSSPVDNNATLNPGTTFATMSNLQTLASQGVRFTNGYAQPVCSPTRAAILSGRQGFRTGVGAPLANNSNIFQATETTLPDAFSGSGSPYQLATFGKWHLGGGNSGYNTLGGWEHFVGISGGGVPDPDGYTNWGRNYNGTVTQNYPTYTTTDQVNEAKLFIDARESADEPWFVWMAFNAPHTPFHEPPAGLLQGGTGTSNKELYQKALEALDSEIGRLLQSVDLNTTNIILVGDNGTPGQVVQAPFGNGHAKGDLYEGGINVPFLMRGPDITGPGTVFSPGDTSNEFVHVIDLYSTILEWANVPVPTSAEDSTSLVPIFEGTDPAEGRWIISEAFGDANPGRSLRSDVFPDYKLIIFGDPDNDLDTPDFQFFNIANDPNETGTPLAIGSLSGTALDAYNHLIAKDTTLGGGYSDPPSGNVDTIYIELPTGQVLQPDGMTTFPVPQLANGQGNAIHPSSIVVDGVDVTAGYVSRSDSGADLADESDDLDHRHRVKVNVNQAAPYTSATVTFTVQGTDRVFDSVNILVKP